MDSAELDLVEVGVNQNASNHTNDNKQKQRRRQLAKGTGVKAPKRLIEPGLAGRRLANLRQRLDSEQQLALRSRGLTVCLVCLTASVSCLSPYLNLHLNQRIGLLLFESDLLQFKSSMLTLGASLLILVILYLGTLVFLGQKSKRNIIQQKVIRRLLSLLAIISSIAYMSLYLLVPQIKQIQRMPLATFDCNANLITIENCQQQFSSEGSEPSLWQVGGELLAGKLEANSEKLIKKLNCLKYIDQKPTSRKLELPTRFLLHNCGLVCRPQKPILNLFGDDILIHSTNVTEKGSDNQTNRPLIAPYDRSQDQSSRSSNDATAEDLDQQRRAMSNSQVSLRVCFSGESSGGPSYKQFCIDNLANAANQHNQDHHTLTIGQLNAMLRLSTAGGDTMRAIIHRDRSDSNDIDEQATQFMNPVVQFESHVRNWPHMSSDKPTINEPSNDSEDLAEEQTGRWCKFKPVPPFIVNNKPFSDIQCSLEHEYTITTDSQRGAERIYLKKSSMERGQSESVARERCNIQCKVNILYQVKLDITSASPSSRSIRESTELLGDLAQYYLPLKPCVIVSGEGNKELTVRYYLILRTVADSTLLLTFIMLDLFLLFESIDKHQFLLEAKKLRLTSLLLALVLVPLLLATSFDLAINWSSNDGNSRLAGYLDWLLSRDSQLWQSLTDIYVRFTSGSSSSHTKQRVPTRPVEHFVANSRNRHNQSSTSSSSPAEQEGKLALTSSSQVVIDANLLPPIFYSICMFALAINAARLPIPRTQPQLVRASSTEELGIANSKQETDAKKSSQDEKEVKQEKKSVSANDGRKIAIFILLCLFMGIQFNLSQLGQRQIFIETLGNPTISVGSQTNKFQCFWFILATKSSASLVCLVASMLLFDEISTFLSSLSPFKPTSSVSKEMNKSKVNEVRLLLHLSLALLIYATRHYALSSVSSSSNLKWLVIFLYQLAELFNLPLVWFAISARAHELIREHPIYMKLSRHLEDDLQNTTQPRWALEFHLIVQSALAIVYFVLAKCMALFVHTLNASMFLYSDNVDWFISNFYGPASRQQNSTSSPSRQDSLFSPLPGERQTYLHASRLFLRYNSLLCLLLGILLLVNLFYLKWQIWSEQKRAFDLLRRSKSWLARQAFLTGQSDSPSSTSGEGDYIDERLSLDLMRIHSTGHQSPIDQTTRTTPAESGRARGQDDINSDGPRARVLFHYRHNKHHQPNPPTDSFDNSSEFSHSLSSSSVEPQESPKSPTQYGQSISSTISPDSSKPKQAANHSQRETRIPFAMEESLDEIDEETPGAHEDEAEIVTRETHKRRVRLVEEYSDLQRQRPEIDQLQNVARRQEQTRPMVVNYGPPKVIVTTSSTTRNSVSGENRAKGPAKRTISFAPTATLIGQDGRSERQLDTLTSSSSRDSQSVTPQKASPEPSIDGSSINEDEADSIELQLRRR